MPRTVTHVRKGETAQVLKPSPTLCVTRGRHEGAAGSDKLPDGEISGREQSPLWGLSHPDTWCWGSPPSALPNICRLCGDWGHQGEERMKDVCHPEYPSISPILMVWAQPAFQACVGRCWPGLSCLRSGLNLPWCPHRGLWQLTC